MTPEQIRQIAEEVAHLRAFDGGFFPHEKEICEDYEVLLQWLNEHYCLVERSKVVEKYIEAECYDYPIGIEIPEEFKDNVRDARCVKNVLIDLFGSETFNKKEE